MFHSPLRGDGRFGTLSVGFRPRLDSNARYAVTYRRKLYWMHTLDHIRHLFEYDDWANRETATALELGPSDKARQIFAHLLITKQEYFERLAGKDSTGFDFWPDLTLDECRELNERTTERFRELLSGADDSLLDRTARYKTSEGIPHENSYRELLTHVLFHSSIHRGNIVLKMREEGLEPPKIDYILYLRR
jgi:uncharacterized damage-inducible protein DinB